jgi:hypothetical protein
MPIDSVNKWEYNISGIYADIVDYRGSMSAYGITLPEKVDGYIARSFSLRSTSLPLSIKEVVILDGVSGNISSGFFPSSTEFVFIGKNITGLNREFNNCKNLSCVFFNGPKPYWRPTSDLNDTVFPWEPNLMEQVILWYRPDLAEIWYEDGWAYYNPGGWEPGLQYGLSNKYYAHAIDFNKPLMRIKNVDKYNKYDKSLVYLRKTGSSWIGKATLEYKSFTDYQCIYDGNGINKDSGLFVTISKNNTAITTFSLPETHWDDFDIFFSGTGDYNIRGINSDGTDSSIGYGEPDKWINNIRIKAVYSKDDFTGNNQDDYTSIYTDYCVDEDMLKDALFNLINTDFVSNTAYEFNQADLIKNFNAPTTGFFPTQTGFIGASKQFWEDYYPSGQLYSEYYIYEGQLVTNKVGSLGNLITNPGAGHPGNLYTNPTFFPDNLYTSPNGTTMPYLFFPNDKANDVHYSYPYWSKPDDNLNTYRFSKIFDDPQLNSLTAFDTKSFDNFKEFFNLYYSLNNFSGSYENENFGNISKIVGLNGVDAYGSFYWTPGINLHVDAARYPSINFMVSNSTDYLKTVVKISSSVPQLEYSASIRVSYNGISKLTTPITTVAVKKRLAPNECDVQCVTNEFGEIESYWELIFPIDKSQISVKGTLVTLEIAKINLKTITERCPYEWQMLGYDKPTSRCRDYSFQNFADFPWVKNLQSKINSFGKNWTKALLDVKNFNEGSYGSSCNLYVRDNGLESYIDITKSLNEKPDPRSNEMRASDPYLNADYPSMPSECRFYEDNLNSEEYDMIVSRRPSLEPNDTGKDVNFVGCFNDVRLAYYDDNDTGNPILYSDYPADLGRLSLLTMGDLTQNDWIRNSWQFKFCKAHENLYIDSDKQDGYGPHMRTAYSCPGMGEFEIQFTNIIPYKYKKDCLGSWPIKFTPNANQTGAYLFFSGGKNYPISDQNGWDWGNTGTGGNNPYSESLITHPFTGAERIFLSKRTGAAFWKEGPWWITPFAHPLVARINANPPINNVINLVDALLIEEYDFISYKCTGFISGLLSYDIGTKEFTYSAAKTGINGTGIANALNSGHKIYITEPISDNNIFDWVDYYPHEISGNRFKLERRYIPSKIEINQRNLNIGTGFVVINSNVEPTSNFSNLSFIYPNNNLIADNLAYEQLDTKKEYLGFSNKSEISDLPLKIGVHWNSVHFFGGYNGVGYYPYGYTKLDAFRDLNHVLRFKSGILPSFPKGYYKQTPVPVNYKGPYV